MHTWLKNAGARPILVGVVHLPATPGAPRFAGDMGELLDRARADAAALVGGGADALIVENFGDVPFFLDRVPPETLVAMARAVGAVASVAEDRPVGVNVLRNDARGALGLCAATEASFLRVNVHVGAMVTDQGLTRGRAAETLRERTRLCPDALLLADVHVKHAAPLVARPIEEAALETVERGLADALVVSGTRTGSPPSDGELARVRERLPGTPLLVGSGLDETNASSLLLSADGAIVGTSLKRGGRVEAPVDPGRVRRLRAVLDDA